MTGEPAIPVPHEPPVDVGAFRTSMEEAGVGAVVPAVLSAFLEDLPGRWDELRRAVEAGDGDTIGRAAHALKSSAGTIHAQRLYAILTNLESSGRNLGLDESKILVVALAAEVERIKTHLATILERE